MNFMKNSKIPPSIFISNESFANSWAKLVMKIMQIGMELPTEYGNQSKDVQSTIVMTGKAIKQIENIELHPQEPFGKTRVLEYLEQFTREYDYNTYGFKYTYLDRLTRPTDQLKILKEKLKDSEITRRAQAITWRPDQDSWSTEPPCLQRIWIRPITPKEYEIHLTWRSRDAYGAWSSNLCAILWMLRREVLPDGVKVVKLVDFCDSAHIYDYDWDAAKKVRLLK